MAGFTSTVTPGLSPIEEIAFRQWAREQPVEVLERAIAEGDAAREEINRRETLPEEATGPGSVTAPLMVNARNLDHAYQMFIDAGCTCGDPLEAIDTVTARDTHCPIKGHGDPSIPTSQSSQTREVSHGAT